MIVDKSVDGGTEQLKPIQTVSAFAQVQYFVEPNVKRMLRSRLNKSRKHGWLERVGSVLK